MSGYKRLQMNRENERYDEGLKGKCITRICLLDNKDSNNVHPEEMCDGDSVIPRVAHEGFFLVDDERYDETRNLS